jgi:hypothetical protein
VQQWRAGRPAFFFTRISSSYFRYLARTNSGYIQFHIQSLFGLFFRDSSERIVKLTVHNRPVCRLGITELHICSVLHVRGLVLSNEHFCHFLLLLRSVFLCVERDVFLGSEVIIGPVWARFSLHNLTV